MKLGDAPLFFERIRGGAAGAGRVWLRKFGAEVVFFYLELREALTNTPIVAPCDLGAGAPGGAQSRWCV
jgi:hypothetical protein